MPLPLNVITPLWSCPGVRAFTTTRYGGCSKAPYDDFNLALHVEDDPTAVAQNRARLQEVMGLPHEPLWLNQVHSTIVCNARDYNGEPTADAMIATESGQICVVQTADCLPILLADPVNRTVAAIHAGWRGLEAGIVQATLQQMPNCKTTHAWIGPAISQAAFEVGIEVKAQFVDQDPNFEMYFAAHPSDTQKCFADIKGIAAAILRSHGLCEIVDSGHCTYTEADKFFSYRRQATTGRIASLIWLTD